MKQLLAALLLLLTLPIQAQTLPTDSTTGKIVYRGTVPLPAGVTQAQAFGRAKIWLADAFASKAILADDAASGLLSGGGAVTVKQFLYSFRVRLQIQGTQIRYRIDDFAWQTDAGTRLADRGTPEEQRDSKMSIGRGSRAKILAELDAKVRAGLTELGTDLAGSF